MARKRPKLVKFLVSLHYKLPGPCYRKSGHQICMERLLYIGNNFSQEQSITKDTDQQNDELQ